MHARHKAFVDGNQIALPKKWAEIQFPVVEVETDECFRVVFTAKPGTFERSIHFFP